ncbi:MAG: Gfo/Idh/MocA family protein [Candidatus Bathyarchaeia archaeon]
MDKVRVGVVGMGKMGLLHSGILNVLPDVEFVGACEPVKLTRRILQKALPKITIVEDITELETLKLDALFITTPTRSHYAVAKTALDCGIAKNLFIEKPLSSSYNESKNLSDLINQKGVGMVGYVRRFMVTFMKAKELLDAGSIGKPLSFSIKMASSDFFQISDPTVSIARGGVMRDLGCYPIDLLLWYFGSCKIDSAELQSVTGPGAIDIANFTVKGDDLVPPGQVSVSWVAEGYRMPEVKFSITGSRGSLLANDDYVRLDSEVKSTTFYRLNLGDYVNFWLGSPEYYREDECFIQAITQGMPEDPSFESASTVELAIEEVERKASE